VATFLMGTAFVLIVKVAEVASAGTVMLAGTFATASLVLVNVTTAPPVGAGLLRVTMPCEGVPPLTFAGLSVRETKATDAPPPVCML